MSIEKKEYSEEEFKIIIDLYKHEDTLLWAKVKFIMLFNTALFGAWYYLIVNKDPILLYSGDIVSGLGVLTNLLLALTVYSSRRHIKAYRDKWTKDIFTEGNKFAGVAPFKLTTSVTMIILVAIVSVVWLVLLYKF